MHVTYLTREFESGLSLSLEFEEGRLSPSRRELNFLIFEQRILKVSEKSILGSSFSPTLGFLNPRSETSPLFPRGVV